MDLDKVADELYGVPPGRFVAERHRHVQEARDAGKAGLAKEIGRLRRPTVAAWAVNLLSRHDRLGELLELGDELRASWSRGDGADLADLTRRRTRLVGDLVRAAQDLGTESGQPVSEQAAVEVQKTLDAATVDEDAARQVRAGRLVRPLEYTGFTPMPAPPGARPSTSKKKENTADPEAERRALEAAVEEAEKEAEEARRDHEEWRAELAEAEAERDAVTSRIEELERELDALRERLAPAERRHRLARREEERAGRAAKKAADRLAAARLAADRQKSP